MCSLLPMPWNRADYPSIQVGLLKGHLVRRGLAVRAAYPYLDLASRLGSDLYLRLADSFIRFSGKPLRIAAGSRTRRTGDRYLLESEELTAATLATVRTTIGGFMRDLVASDLGRMRTWSALPVASIRSTPPFWPPES